MLVYLNALPITHRGGEYGVTVKLGYIGAAADPATLEKVLALADAGTFVPQVAATLPLSDAVAAHRQMESGTVTRGRLVLTM